MQIINPEVVANVPCQVGESPLWHPERNLLYWVDIPNGRLYAYSPEHNSHELVLQDKPISGFTIQEDGSLLLFMQGGQVAIWDFERLRVLIDLVPGSEDSIFNDTIADPEHRVFAGMKAGNSHKGQLYRLDTDRSMHLLLEDIGQPNGMGFTSDLKNFYFTDTHAHSIYLFDYDRRTGSITNQREFVHIDNGKARPDGMTVDSAGCVWSAHWEGSCIARYSPDGQEIARVELPTEKVSSVTFGGSDYSQLFITTAGGSDRSDSDPLAGSLFRIITDAIGVPEFRSKIM